jgi:hypothetical protein
MRQDDIDEATRERAEQFGFIVEKRENGWYLFGELGEEVGPIAEVSQIQAFLDWLEDRRSGDGISPA